MTGIRTYLEKAFYGNRRLQLGLAVIFFLSLLIVLRVGYSYHEALKYEISVKEGLYENSYLLLANNKDVQSILKKAETRIIRLESGLLKTEKPPIGAARLQASVKEFSQKNGITIKTERALKPVDEGIYIKVPVEFEFEADISQLKNLIYSIASSPLIIGIKDLKIKRQDMKNHQKLDISMIVEGVIKMSNRKGPAGGYS